MSWNVGPGRATALAVLPLGAFLVGPALDALAPDTLPDTILESVLPTLLPGPALLLVAFVSYRRTRSAARTIRLSAAAASLLVIGAAFYLLVVWASASGS